MAFSGRFGQLDVAMELGKTGAKIASSQLDNPVAQSMISQISQTVTVATTSLTEGAAFAGQFLAPALLLSFVTSWIFAVLGDRPGPVDNPVYVNIWNTGVKRVDDLKSVGLTDQEINFLAFKIGFIPMISITGTKIDWNYYDVASGWIIPTEVPDPSQWIVTGIYAPAEKKYLNAIAWAYQGADPYTGVPILMPMSEGDVTQTYLTPYTLPWGTPPTNINEPISQGIIQKLGGAVVEEKVIPALATQGVIIPENILQGGVTPMAYTNIEIQNLKIIEAKIEYQIAWDSGDQAGMNAAHIKAEQARAAGGTIPAASPLTQDEVNAYQAYKASGGTLEAGFLAGIPTWALIAGGVLLLMGFLKGRK